MAGLSGGISFPNIHINSPYQVTYLLGVISLATIFSITLLIAQHLLREGDTKFDSIIYATPVAKLQYLSSKLIAIVSIAVLSMFLASVGLCIGQMFSAVPVERKGEFDLINYLWPLFVLVIPNIILCIAIISSSAWLTRNKLVIYISGLSIYIIYIIGSIFSNSPLIAGSAPSSPEETSLFAKLDPFGLAAFFEQTRYWTAADRNSQLLSLSGNFLFNRLLWLGVSVILIVFSYSRFSFRNIRNKAARRIRIKKEITLPAINYKPVGIVVHNRKHNFDSLVSFIRINTSTIFKGIPFLLISLLWIVLFGIEINNAINGDPRLGSNFPRTGVMITVILETLPFFALLVILFYSSELIWKARSVKFNHIEESTPVHPLSLFFSRLISLSAIPIYLLFYSILICIAFQIMNGYTPDRIDLYVSLVYFICLPLILTIILVTIIQSSIKNKYLGLCIAAIVVLLTNSSLGKMIGIKHPLLRFANSFNMKYFDMNGFGTYTTSFHWQMLCWTAFAVSVILIYNNFFSKNVSGKNFVSKILLSVNLILFLFAAGYIFYQTNIKHDYLSQTEIFDWKEEYEKKFKPYKKLAQPTITDVQTTVDLYPDENRYDVKGEYSLVNRTNRNVDSLLIHIDKNIVLQNIHIQNAKLLKDESKFEHFWYKFDKPLQPGDSTRMQFSFTSGWSPFAGHTAFNSIIENGSFMRISRYFPSFGYFSENEISNSIERQKRNMKQQDELTKVEAGIENPYDYQFINLDATVSTSGDQFVVGQGDLIKQWSKNNRNYFQYKTDRPVPFRFAFSSAKYKVQKDLYKNIPIEIYFDSRHEVNVQRLISEVKKTLEYCENNFGPYPHKVIRFAEISAFAEGFAATAYPTVIYMKEDQGFATSDYGDAHTISNRVNVNDIMNQLAGHELSHQWWGSAQIAPEYKEGGWLLTETLAKYTELVLFEKSHGLDAALEKVKMHIDLYLSNRSFSKETPLYKTTFETPHIPYDKGLVVMYQLRQLIGEQNMNAALKSLLQRHAYPNPPPSSIDLLNEIYKHSPAEAHAKVNELFKEIIIYDSKIETVEFIKTSGENYDVNFTALVEKFVEDGNGKRRKTQTDSSIDVGIFFKRGKVIKSFPITNGKVNGKFRIDSMPSKIVIDPYLKTIDSFLKDNEKQIVIQ